MHDCATICSGHKSACRSLNTSLRLRLYPLLLHGGLVEQASCIGCLAGKTQNSWRRAPIDAAVSLFDAVSTSTFLQIKSRLICHPRSCKHAYSVIEAGILSRVRFPDMHTAFIYIALT